MALGANWGWQGKTWLKTSGDFFLIFGNVQPYYSVPLGFIWLIFAWLLKQIQERVADVGRCWSPERASVEANLEGR